MKQHPFFAVINWSHLERKIITPPVILNMDDDEDGMKEEFGQQPEDEEEKFLNFNDEKDMNQSPNKELFKDADYIEEN